MPVDAEPEPGEVAMGQEISVSASSSAASSDASVVREDQPLTDNEKRRIGQLLPAVRRLSATPPEPTPEPDGQDQDA
jgi:hypothetical protein